MNSKSSSTSNYYLIPIFVLMMTVLSGQTPYNKVSDFNMHQQNAYSVIEVEDRIFVAGQALVKGQEIDEREIFFAEFSSDLEPLNYTVLKDEDDFQTLGNNARDLVEYSGSLFRSFNELAPGNEKGQIVQYHVEDGTLTSYYEVRDTLNNLESVGGSSLILNKSNQLVISLINSVFQEDRTFWIQVLNPDSGALIKQRVFTEVGLSLFCRELVENAKGYVVLGHSFDKSNNRTTFIWQLDYDLNALKKIELEERNYYHIYIESVLDDGAIVFTNNEHLGNSNNWRSVLIKVDSELNVVWETIVGTSEYSRDFSYYTGIVNSHDKDGYVLCGVNESEDSLANRRGQIAKISEEGDSIWYRQIRPLMEDNAGAELFDIIQSSDGHYLATGKARNPNALNDSIFIKTWLIKFDEQGHMVVKDTTDAVTTLYNNQLRIFPNPTSDLIYLEHDEITDLHYVLYNEQGQLLLTREDTERYHTYMLSLSSYPAGIYYLHVRHPDGRQHTERIVRVDD